MSWVVRVRSSVQQNQTSLPLDFEQNQTNILLDFDGLGGWGSVTVVGPTELSKHAVGFGWVGLGWVV